MSITVKGARANANKTQREVANALKVHVQTYANLERHPERFTVAQAERFARFVHQDVSDIIFLPDNSNYIREPQA